MNHQIPPSNPSQNSQETLSELRKERDGLQQQVARLESERDQLSKALVDLLREKISLSEQEILAQIGHEKPLREFLRELRSELVES